MLSGRRLDLIEPSALDIEITDIAHGLARVARWNGQTHGKHAFSVAQHCCLVHDIAVRLKPKTTAEWRLMALLHDGPEYVIGDMISPFKAVIGDEYRDLEARLLAAIHLRFSLPTPTPATARALIKRADRIAAYFEATALAGFEDTEAVRFFGRPRGVSADQFDLKPWPADVAQARYLDAFARLEGLR